MARDASSLPGIGWSILSGVEFVSRIATTGIPSLLASSIAIASLFVSITKRISGKPPISLIPPIALSSLLCSRVSFNTSFFVRAFIFSLLSISSRSLNLLIELDTVFQFVKIPAIHV